MQRRSGSAVLEGFFVLNAMIFLAFGCVEFGHYFYIKHTLQGASREGARAAATGTSNTEVTNTVKASMDAAGIPSTNYAVTITDTTSPTPSPITITASNPTAGTAIVVKVTATWGTVGIRPMGLIGAGKQVVGATTMRREG
jgi:Flp pilus assembly protein TadG